MKGLKIKNCEGFDRIPLRILTEGAEFLLKPITKLMQIIYTTKTVPDQWRIAKVIPTHKSGSRDNIVNYINNIAHIGSTSIMYFRRSGKINIFFSFGQIQSCIFVVVEI